MIEKDPFRIALSRLVDKIPPGKSDKKLLSEILDEIYFRFGGEDLFTMKNEEFMSMNTEKILEIIKKTVGMTEDEEILRSSEKLVKYDYHDFFAPKLYEKILEVENRLEGLREHFVEFHLFLKSDPSDHFHAILENTYDHKHKRIALELGMLIVTKDDYFKIKKEFFSQVNANVLERYYKVVESFSERVKSESGVVAMTEIIRFNEIKDKIKNRIYDLEFLHEKLKAV